MLIIHLKRFSFVNYVWRDKINEMVSFPLRWEHLSKLKMNYSVCGQLLY